MDYISEDLNHKLLFYKRQSLEYDCLVPVSGGKDGIFMLWYIKTHTSLNPLAFHIDNWYISDCAKANIEVATKKLGCDLITHRVDWHLVKPLYSALLQKVGEICIACEVMIDVLPVQYAIEKNIPSIIWGLTPSQLKSKHIEGGYLLSGRKYYQQISDYYKQIIEDRNLDVINGTHVSNKLLLNDCFFDNDVKFPEFVFPFYYLGYDAVEVENKVSHELGWKRPLDAGGTSLNCTINSLHIYLKEKVKGVDFYTKMLDKKLKNHEVSSSVAANAVSVGTDFDDFKAILDDLSIKCDEDLLVAGITCFKKSVLLRKESNISQ